MNSNLVNLDGPHAEIFRQRSAERRGRIKLQNKCVEMSIQVTSGLAVAFAGLMVAWMNYWGTPIMLDNLEKDVGYQLIVMVLYFYVLIQLLLLSNYLYHTVFLQCFDHVYHAEFVETSRTFLGSEEPVNIPTKVLGFLVVSVFQPSIFYACIVIALLVLWGVVSHYRLWICVIESIWLIVLVVVHCSRNVLAKYSVNGYLGKKVS